MKQALSLSLTLGLLLAGTLMAGTVYQPAGSDLVIAGNQLSTRVWITNPTQQFRTYKIVFLPAGTDGSLPDRKGLPDQLIAPGQTLVLEGLVPQGDQGLVEIDADPALVFGSEIGVSAPEQVSGSLGVPLVGSENLLPKNAVAHLQALRRDEFHSTSVGIVNLGKDVAACTASLFRSDGQSVGGTAFLTFPPVSVRQFDEIFALLGVTAVADARVEVSCDQPFYAYGLVLGASPSDSLYIQPSVTGSSALRPPGIFTDFVIPGNFLVATTNNPYRAFNLPAARNETYSRIEVEFDFDFGGFNSDLFHTVTTLRSGGLYFEVAMRGDNGRTFLDTPGESARGAGPWRRGASYHLRIVYDVVEDRAILEVMESNKVVQRLEARANRVSLGNIDGSLRIDFSQTKVFDDAFFPLWGSTFANLEVRLFPL